MTPEEQRAYDQAQQAAALFQGQSDQWKQIPAVAEQLQQQNAMDQAAQYGIADIDMRYDPTAAYDYGTNATGLTGEQRTNALDSASKGTAQVRNPYDYIIGRDQNYVGNMAAQQQALGQQTQAGFSALQDQAGQQAAANGAALQGMGNYASAYGVDAARGINANAAAMAQYGNQAAQGINAGAAGLNNTAYSILNQANAAGGRAGPALDFGSQNATIGGALGYADRLGNQAGVAGPNFGRQDMALNSARNYAQQLASQQQGPSAAQAMLQSGANQSMSQSLALARSGRGFGGSAQGQAQALQQNAATMQNVANQSAMLRAQEDQAWRAQQAQNLSQAAGLMQGNAGQYGNQQSLASQVALQNNALQAQNLGNAANIYTGAGSQYGQQTALGAQTALQNSQQNDAYSAQLYGLGLQGQGQALNAQSQAANIGLQGQNAALSAQQNAGQLGLSGIQTGANIYGQGSQLEQQGTQLQGALLGQGSAAASQGDLNAFGFNQAQNTADVNRENMVTQDYGIRSGVAIQNQQMQNQQNGAIAGAIGTGAGALIGSLGGPAGTAGGAAVGGAIGNEAGRTSDARAKRDIRPVDMNDAYRVLQGPPATAGVPRRDVDYAALDAVNPYTNLRPAQGYSYEYKDPQKYGEGRFVGPMAQDLEKSPATEGVVYTDPSGVKKIDTGRLALVNTSVISDQQRQQDELGQRLADIERGLQDMGARRSVASDERTKKNVRPASRYRAPSSDPEDAPVSLRGYGFSPAEYFRDTSAPAPSKQAHPALVNEQLRQGGENARRFDSLDRLEGRPVPETSPVRAFVRNAAAHALDTAALPVTLAGKGAAALGYPNRAASLDANEALEDVDWLANTRDPVDSRFLTNEERAQNPLSTAAGGALGDAVGGAGVGGLAERSIGAVSREAGALSRLGKGAGSRSPRALAAKAYLNEHPEIGALDYYMGSGYDHVNHTLRADAGVHPSNFPEHVKAAAREKAERLKVILSDAEKAGHVQPGTVQRGIEVPPDVIRDWIDKGAVENRSFWSTTADPAVAERFATNNGEPGMQKVLLNIKQKSAVPVGAVNGGYEDELLLAPGKKWEITGHRVDDYGNPIVDLRQVSKFKPGVTPALSFDGSRSGEFLGGRARGLIQQQSAEKERAYGRR